MCAFPQLSFAGERPVAAQGFCLFETGGSGSKSTCSSHYPTSPLPHEVAVLFPTPEHEQMKYTVNRVAKQRLLTERRAQLSSTGCLLLIAT